MFPVTATWVHAVDDGATPPTHRRPWHAAAPPTHRRPASRARARGNDKGNDAASSHLSSLIALRARVSSQGAPRCPLKTDEEMEELVHQQSYCHVNPCGWCGRIDNHGPDNRGPYVLLPVEPNNDILYGLCVNCLTRYRAGMSLPQLRLKQLRRVLLHGKMYVAMHAVIATHRGSVIAEFLSSPMKHPLVVAQHPHSFWVHDVRQQPKGKGKDYVWIGKGVAVIGERKGGKGKGKGK